MENKNKGYKHSQRHGNYMDSLQEIMKRIHGNPFPERLYIGVIKFYDSRKGFGYIASNNCGMKSSMYEQDFYVDSSSFIEDSAKTDRRLVVFQWEAQESGKRRAIKVRNYKSSTEGDLNLALNYYGDYEFVQLKDQRINMFNHLGVTRPQMLPLLKRQIEASSECTSKEICDKIYHLVDKYKTELPDDKRYIFTKDYDNENRTLWEEIFTLLKREDWIELLNTIPPVALYVSDPSIIKEWIDNLSIDISDSVKLKDLGYSKRYLSEDQIFLLNNKIEEPVNQHILSIIEENKKRTSLPTIFGYGITSHGPTQMERSIREYLHYTSRNFDDEIAGCKRQVKINQFNELVEEYDPSKYNSIHSLEKIIDVFRSIDNREGLKPIIVPLIEQKITSLSESKSFLYISKLLDRIKEDFNEVVVNTLATIKDSVIEYLTESLDKCIDSDSQYEFEKNFEKEAETLLSIYDDSNADLFRKLISERILKSDSLYIISCAAMSRLKWVNDDTAITRSLAILDTKSTSELLSVIHKYSGNLLDEVKESIVSRLLSAYAGKPLCECIDGAVSEWVEPISHNIDLLRNVKNFADCDSAAINQSWETYINTLCVKDILALYYRDVIERLPEYVLVDIVENLSIADTYCPGTQWYSAPAFKNQGLKQVFSSSTTNTFTPIANYLKVATLSEDNIYKIVWLVELLSFNKPEDMDYWESRQWEEGFKHKLQLLKSAISDPKVSVILWSVYFETGAAQSALAEIYSWLPPYLQIRVLKRFMMGIAEGKISHTPQSLYAFLGGGKMQLCLPVEIVFSYLILREKYPSEMFSDKHMLALLSEREDHPEWIGIRQFVDECHGRVQRSFDTPSYSKRENPFYNGKIIVKSQEITLFISRKMLDARGGIQKYNNKYFGVLQKIISLNFNYDMIHCETTVEGIIYHFAKSAIKSVIGLCRQFNIYWDGAELYFCVNEESDDYFCECRLANELSRNEETPFYWCDNKPCFRHIIRYRTSEEWEQYTLLDFMRIFNIPVDYTNKMNVTTRFGYYIFFNTYLKGFAKFYEHLKCRKCGNLLHPLNLSNFASRSVTEFACNNPECECQDQTVYLNHCFNKPKCKTIIDSRDSKQCPNGQYICSECGGCCSTNNFRIRISNLHQVGGNVSPWLENFVNHELGHWERNERFCYKCGKKMIQSSTGFHCPDCGVNYPNSQKHDC